MANDKEKQIDEHRAAVAMTGSISDFQLTNMKAWSFILFDNVKQVKIDYNFKKSEDSVAGELYAGKVSYDMDFEKEPAMSIEDLKYRLGQLEFWTKFLFWQDTEVEILKKGKKWVV